MFFFLPYKIERRTSGLPWVTITLIALNVIVFFGTWLQLRTIAPAFGFTWGWSGLYTWFTSMFLHADPLHIGFNMFFLWLFGSFVEDAIGPVRYAALYCAGGLVAGLSHVAVTALFTPQYLSIPAIGASGALAAVMGLFMVRFYKNKVRIAYFFMIWLYPKWGVWKPSSLVAIGVWFLGELWSGVWVAAGYSNGVATWAHIGGLVFGAVVGLALGAKYDADTEYLADEASEYSLSGSHEMAAVKYEQLIERTPDDPEALLGEVRSIFGSHGADTAKGAEDLRRAVELLVKQGRPERVLLAWEELQGPATTVPIDAKTLATIASLAEGRERPDMASAAYWRVVQEYPDSREAERALFRLSHIYLTAGMGTEAQQCWQRFCAEHPHSEWHAFADPALAASA